MGNDIEDERAIREYQSKGSWELNRSIDERCSLALIMTVSNVIIIITRPSRIVEQGYSQAGTF